MATRPQTPSKHASELQAPAARTSQSPRAPRQKTARFTSFEQLLHNSEDKNMNTTTAALGTMTLSPTRTPSPATPTTPKRPVLPPHLRPSVTPPRSMQARPSLINQSVPWSGAPELKVHLRRLPHDWGTLHVYKHLSHLIPPGTLDRIEVCESRGEQFVNGYVILRPAPPNAQWLHSGLTIIDENHCRQQIDCIPEWPPRKRNGASNASPERTPSARVATPITRLDAGMMQMEDEMLVLFTATATAETPLTVAVKMDRERTVLEVKFNVRSHGNNGVVISQYKLCVNFPQIQHATELSAQDGEVAFLITMDMPPVLFRKTTDIEGTHDKKVLAWNESQTWYRQTGIDERPNDSSVVTQLRKDSATLDIGRWLTYRLSFKNTEADRAIFQAIGKALVDHNVPLTTMSRAVITSGNRRDFWAWSDNPGLQMSGAPGNSVLTDLHMMSAPLTQLEFAVRYQLEVCLSQGAFNECNMHPEFIEELATVKPDRATKLLEKVADDKKRFYEPMDALRLLGQVSVREKKIPRFCAMVRAAVVTPSTIYLTTPVMETSNRVIREYRHYGDRFLRVKFTDERYRGRIMTGDGDTMAEVLTRVYRTMKNGINIGDRHYDFLAFGNAQFREHGAYFFSSVGTVTADKIRQWMGNFTKINIVAKYASRVGQCFSTTRATSVGVSIVALPDIKRNNFCFTDGVGKISPLLAQIIADELGLPNPSVDYPSVFQFRLGGCKGVLAVDPALKSQVVHIRPSQEKFPAKYHGLEICRISQFSSANLNVQIILVLNALGVETNVFCKKMKETLADLVAAMTDERKATEQLNKNIDFSQSSLVLADMIYDGFMTASELFLISCLRLWHSWMVKYLKEKARIPVEHGAFILGCVDETATLKGHFYGGHTPDLQPRDPASLPEIFLQISDPAMAGKYKVVEGVCILARNPSLHPGDVRVVRAVNVTQLQHLKNCVVLPQTGDRDLSNMCSGGDLDGDDYLVMWDAELIPKEWNHAPMDYEAEPAVVSAGPVAVDDITAFFVNHMKNDNLGRIAMAHRFWADAQPEGVKDQKCLELAQLHSKAVDYAKTGVAAVMGKELRVKRFPHWSERRNTYHSRQVLGRLYDMVQRKDFRAAWDLPFDTRILEAYELGDELLQGALDVKLQYDEAVRRIMAQHGITTEFEVYTTFVLSHDSDIGDYKFAETLGETVSGLKECHKELCYERAGTTAHERDWTKLGPFIAAMYAVTAREVTAALTTNGTTRLVGGQLQPAKESNFSNMPFMSFPWIFAKELGYIARRRSPTAGFNPARSATGTGGSTQKKMTNVDLLGEFVVDPLQDVSTADGVIHEGDELNLYHPEEAQSQISTPSATHDIEPVPSAHTGQATKPVEQSGNAHVAFSAEIVSRAVAPAVETRAGGQPSKDVTAPVATKEDEDSDGEAEQVFIGSDEQGSALDKMQRLMGF